ncbi:hypothetical protein NIES4075_22380 [Tolypothrix sp. NIES-4075]|nr:hypothetical protein NIES4075_22380 [Tolypothrix sp. NIES-4075]
MAENIYRIDGSILNKKGIIFNFFKMRAKAALIVLISRGQSIIVVFNWVEYIKELRNYRQTYTNTDKHILHPDKSRYNKPPWLLFSQGGYCRVRLYER